MNWVNEWDEYTVKLFELSSYVSKIPFKDSKEKQTFKSEKIHYQKARRSEAEFG